MKRFVLTKPAERDLDHIKRYLIEKAGPTVARRVMKEIGETLVALGSEPGTGHVREDFTERPLKFFAVYSYLIVYDPQTKPVQIVRILHGMRDVEDILELRAHFRLLRRPRKLVASATLVFASSVA